MEYISYECFNCMQLFVFFRRSVRKHLLRYFATRETTVQYRVSVVMYAENCKKYLRAAREEK